MEKKDLPIGVVLDKKSMDELVGELMFTSTQISNYIEEFKGLHSTKEDLDKLVNNISSITLRLDDVLSQLNSKFNVDEVNEKLEAVAKKSINDFKEESEKINKTIEEYQKEMNDIVATNRYSNLLVEIQNLGREFREIKREKVEIKNRSLFTTFIAGALVGVTALFAYHYVKLDNYNKKVKMVETLNLQLHTRDGAGFIFIDDEYLLEPMKNNTIFLNEEAIKKLKEIENSNSYFYKGL